MKKLKEFKDLIENFLQNEIYLPIISDFLDWFGEKLKIHFNKNTPKLIIKKGDIFYVNLGKNIGSELNKLRPCIIYSIKKANFGNTVLVIPLKSFKGKINNFQFLINKTNKNNLKKDSIADLTSLKQIDKKRILTKIGNLEKEYIKNIDDKIIQIFGIKKQKE